MKSVPVDIEAFVAAGLQYEHADGSDTAYFTIEGGGRVPVTIRGNNLLFMPLRSSSQKHILQLLGISAEA